MYIYIYIYILSFVYSVCTSVFLSVFCAFHSGLCVHGDCPEAVPDNNMTLPGSLALCCFCCPVPLWVPSGSGTVQQNDIWRCSCNLPFFVRYSLLERLHGRPIVSRPRQTPFANCFGALGIKHLIRTLGWALSINTVVQNPGFPCHPFAQQTVVLDAFQQHSAL